MPAEAAPAVKALPYKPAANSYSLGVGLAPALFFIPPKKIIPPGGGIMHSQLELVIHSAFTLIKYKQLVLAIEARM